MLAFVVRRLLGLVPTLLVIVALSFLVIRLAPGSPFESERGIPPEVLAALNARYGFDRPLPEQLGRYLSGLAHGDLGLSTKYPQRTVNEIIADGLPATLQLAAVALSWALSLGIFAGVVAAVRQNSAWDHGLMGFAMLGISLPSFVLGPLLALIFGLTFFLLPPGGWGGLRHVILPLRLRADAVTALDEVWPRRAVRSRTDFIRRALADYLEKIGAADAAVGFRDLPNAGG